MYYVYIIRCQNSPYYKIGVSENVRVRLESLQAGCPYELTIEAVCCANTRLNAYRIEADIHRSLAKDRVRSGGEWFQLHTEQITVLLRDIVQMTE